MKLILFMLTTTALFMGSESHGQEIERSKVSQQAEAEMCYAKANRLVKALKLAVKDHWALINDVKVATEEKIEASRDLLYLSDDLLQIEQALTLFLIDGDVAKLKKELVNCD